MQRITNIISKVYMGILVAAFTGVMLAQLHIDYSFNEAIIASNYYALVFSVFSFAALTLFCYNRQFNISRCDIAIIALSIIASIHSQDGLQTKEVVMSLSYIVLYLSLRLVNNRFSAFEKYATTTILLFGIYQSLIVLRQLYGFEMSRNHYFLVSGDFFNPGPCGIFLAGILVLALTIVKRNNRGATLLSFMRVQYYTAFAALILSFVAIVPTLSRAGWVGAIAGGAILYFAKFKQTLTTFCNKHSLNLKFVLSATILSCFLSCVSIYLLKKESANGRVFIWQNTLSAISKSPILGVGVGCFTQHYADAQAEYFESNNIIERDNPNVAVVGNPEYPFNEVLAITLALGLIGLFIVAYILYHRMFRCDNPYVAVAITIITASTFSYTFYIPLIAILFTYALANGAESQNTPRFHRVYNCFYIIPFVLLCCAVPYILKLIETDKEWREISMFYNMGDYETVVEDSDPLLHELYNNDRFMFEYGHSLNKMENYKLSNEILLQGIKFSTDPMFWNVIGNNYLALGDYDQSAKSYLRAYHQCPSRIYPLYLLTKLYDAKGDKESMIYYGNILLNKEPKIPSAAVDDMKNEVQGLLCGED